MLEVLLAGVSLSALRIPHAEAGSGKAEFFASSLDQNMLEEQKTKSADTLIDDFWNYPHVRNHITRNYLGGSSEQNDVRRKLRDESRMFIPTPKQCEDVYQSNVAHLDELAQNIPKEKYGIFLDGDTQKLYVLKNLGQNRVQFIKGYPVSTSHEEWSNELHSGGTPIGLHHIAEERRGMLGEIVAASKPNGTDNVGMDVLMDGKTERRIFVKSLVGGTGGVAEMITQRLLLVGPNTPPSRAINVHGTNRTNLLGIRGSGGCVRMSSVDVTDLSTYIDVGFLIKEGGTEILGGTPVMIQATWKMNMDKKRHEKEKRDQVPYRKRQNLFEEID